MADFKRNTITEFDSILQHIGYGISVVDNKGNLLIANNQMAKFSGLSSAKALLKAGSREISKKLEFFDSEGNQLSADKLPRSLTLYDGRAHEMSLQYKRKSAAENRWIYIRSVPVYQNKKIKYVVNTVQDITEAKLEENRTSQFIAMASHELKTPLATIKAIAQLLDKRYRERRLKNAEKYFEKIELKVDQLTKIVNSFLDMSKIRSGNMILSLEPFDINYLIDDIIVEFKQYSVKNSFIKKGNVKKLVYSDKLRIGQILTNLIKNAYKYSASDKDIVINVRGEKKFVTVCVRDFGFGIPKKNWDRIFEPFIRGDQKKINQVEGLGIGLFMSRQIITLLGGKLWLKKSSRQGSVFCFKIPYKAKKLNEYKF